MSFEPPPQILAIDDEKDLLEIIQQALEAEGFKVQTAATATEGLQLFERQAAEIKLVLLDYLLPDMTGDVVFECLQQMNPEVRVLLLTGCDDQVAKRMFALGLRGYLQKPFFLEDLVQRVREEIEDHVMTDSEGLAAENLVEIHQAGDEWEGTILVGFLQDNGVEAILQQPPSVIPLDSVEALSGSGKICGVFVLEHEADRARRLVQEFLAAATDPNTLEETAAQALRVDAASIARLRGAVREERQTFELLGWLAVVFFGAMAALWVIWPAWLKVAPPSSGLRLVGAVLLALGAVFAGGWANKSQR